MSIDQFADAPAGHGYRPEPVEGADNPDTIPRCECGWSADPALDERSARARWYKDHVLALT